MKTFLNEAKEEFINITDQAQKMESQIKVHDELLAEKTENVCDLEEQLRLANEYSAEQSKTIERLEEELERQTTKLMSKDKKIEELSKTIFELYENQDSKVSNFVFIFVYFT